MFNRINSLLARFDRGEINESELSRLLEWNTPNIFGFYRSARIEY